MHMADASTTTAPPVAEVTPVPAPEATPEVAPKDVSGEVQVLFEQADGVIKKINDVSDHSVASYKTAFDAAVVTLETLQKAAAGAADAAVKEVYAHAIAKAQELVQEARTGGHEASMVVAKLQGELQALVDQIKILDPKNPLVDGL